MNDKSTTAEEAVAGAGGGDHDSEVAETNLLSPLTRSRQEQRGDPAGRRQ
ncbi:MAG: hypothetical protein ACXWJ4_10490 [Methyloceanibacter sp.]